MTLSWQDIGVVTALQMVMTFLLGQWVNHRLQNSIKHEYDKKLELFKSEQRRREQAAGVARLLAMHFDQDKETKEFNELAWELSLWLDKDTVWEVTKCLCMDETAKDPKELLIMIRKALNNGIDDGLKAGQIVHRLQKSRQ